MLQKARAPIHSDSLPLPAHLQIERNILVTWEKERPKESTLEGHVNSEGKISWSKALTTPENAMESQNAGEQRVDLGKGVSFMVAKHRHLP